MWHGPSDLWRRPADANYTTVRPGARDLAIRGINAQIAHGDTFHIDRHPDLKTDYVLANPAWVIAA